MTRKREREREDVSTEKGNILKRRKENKTTLDLRINPQSSQIERGNPSPEAMHGLDVLRQWVPVRKVIILKHSRQRWGDY